MPAQPSFTLGIEEEFQVIDPETRQLKSHIQEMFAEGEKRLKDEIKREMHDPVIEVGTPICRNIAEARREITRLRREIINLARENGLCIAAAGTHPISHWASVPITDAERYDRIVYELQMLARANLIFGLHVHVGIPSREMAVHVMNQARYFLPHIYALSTNSPFWVGRDTGFKGYRLKVFERFPRTGIPDAFEGLSEYEDYLKLLVRTKCVDNAKKIWWDIRLHPFFDTLEVRVCDAQSRVDDTLAMAALIQAVIVRLHKLQRQNLSFRIYRRRLIDENRWRASRYGLDGKLIDFGREEEREARSLIHEIIEFIDGEIDELGIRREIDHVERILHEGTGSDRQIETWQRTRDLRKVVDMIVDETYEGLAVDQPQAASASS
jgi:carboxylate-amine ligase